MTIKLAPADLAYLLQQVNIGNDYTQLASPLDPNGVHEVNGRNNNLVGGFDANGNWTGLYDAATGQWLGNNINADWGQADTDFLRLFGTSDPSGVNPDAGTTYATVNQTGTQAPVIDGAPRMISNLIASSVTDPLSAAYNPAAVAARDAYGGGDIPVANSVVGSTTAAFIPNPGILGGIPYNEWFVAFGQFFDHGLDFISKGAGYVMVPIPEGDPLYQPGGMNMMMLDRASLSNPASDFDALGNLNPGVVPLYNNNTGLLIDQSQTYGSHSTINALVRQYDASGVVTGKLITGAEDGNGFSNELATWADMKVNALRIGVELLDTDVLDAPLMRVDAVGRLLYTPDPTAHYRSDETPADMGAAYSAASDPFIRDAGGHVLKTNQPVLADMGFTANPGAPGYDAAALAAHYVSGDGRVNENVGLTAVHHVFHEEHNIQVENLKASVTAEAAALATPAEQAAYLANWQTAPGVWDGEKLYQAARIVTESEYNHIAIDQYVGTLYPALPEFVSYSTDINMSVSLEFSQAVFRLGHSMLSETLQIAITDASGKNPGDPGYVPTYTNEDLFDAFLNPAMYDQYGAAGITLGLMNQQGNEVDEFVTPALQQSLLGIPLDLPALNIARGRDVGLPTLNELRQQVHDGLTQNTNNNANASGLAPYKSWSDFGGHLRTPESLVNFVAAYGRDDGGAGGSEQFGLQTARANYLAGTGTLADIRAAAQALLDAYTDPLAGLHDAAVAFMDGAPTFNTTTNQWEFSSGDQGYWDIDLWIGGLAEQPLFDGPLGTTFSFIMLDFAQRLQDGDRFYYLYRMPVGHHLGDQIIAEQFADLIMRTTGLEHVNGDAFGKASATFILDDTDPPDGSGTKTDVDANVDPNDYFNATTALLPDGSPAKDGHIIVAGLGGHDFIIGGLGDDTLYGDAGDDWLEGAQGNDHIYGGDGNDHITDYENDDFISGGAGDDYVSAGPGVLDTIHGNEGNDELHGGDGIDEVFGDDGDDLLYGEGDTDLMMGGDGNDYMEGGDSVDEMFGGNGNDWMRGGVGDDNINGGSGNDLMEGGLGAVANDGDRLNGDTLPGALPVIEWNGDGTEGEMDIVSYEEVPIAIFASLQTANANGTSSNLLDTYALDEGLVGSAQNDTLEGADESTTTSNGAHNQLIGGAGNDRLIGLGGDDLIIGDTLVVRNNLLADMAATFQYDDAKSGGAAPTLYSTIANWRNTGEDRPVFTDTGELGHILGDNGADGDNDIAVYRGLQGDYQITRNADGTVTVHDTRNPADTIDPVTGINTHDGTDTLYGVEFIEFGDGTVISTANSTPTDIQWNGADPNNSSLPGSGSTVALLTATDPDPLASFTYTEIAGGDANAFSVSLGGTVRKTNGNTAQNTTYNYTVRVTDDGGATFQETFKIRTGDNGGNTLDETGTTNDVILYGDDGDDVLTGGDGNDTLFGQDENDTLKGGKGNDVLNGGGADTDTAVFTGAWSDYEFSLVNNNLVVADKVSDRDGIDTLINIERVTFAGTTYTLRVGTNGNNTASLNGTIDPDLILGFNGNDRLNSIGGTDGADVLLGGPGTDTIYGGAGNDWIEGGSGPDTIDGGADTDWAAYKGSQAAVTVNLATGIGTGGDAEGDSIVLGSIENLAGSDLGDTLTGDNRANTLSGGLGADNLSGGDGNDILIGGADGDQLNGGGNTDTAMYSTSAAAVDVNLGTGTASGGDAAGDLLTSIESLYGSQQGDTLTGDGLANVLNGWLGDDHLFGGAGSDTLLGWHGADELNGEAGNDTIVGGTGADTLTGGGDNDTFVFLSNDDAIGDRITDFSTGDRINLASIDANSTTATNDAFSFVNTFTAAGQLIVHTNGIDTFIDANTDANTGTIEFTITLTGDHVTLLHQPGSVIL